MQNDFYSMNEPEIEDMLEDPVMLALLKRDGLTVDDIWQVVTSYRQNISTPLN